MNVSVAAVDLLVEDYISNQRYGCLSLLFKNGKLVLVKKEETMIPLGTDDSHREPENRER